MAYLTIASLAVLFLAAFAGAVAGLVSGQMPLDYVVSLAGFPLGGALAAAILFRRGRRDLIAVWSRRLMIGVGAGLAATLVYDGFRMLVRYVLGINFDPFRVQPVFGQILTGLPTTHAFALTAGWSYHFWTGMMLGMVFAALRPRGGMLWGALFAAIIQLGRWAMYPDVLLAGTTDKEFFANGVIGQLVWGLTLGLSTAILAGAMTRAYKSTSMI